MNGQFLGYTHCARRYGYDVLGCFVRGIAIRADRTDIAQTTLLPGKELVAAWYNDLLRHAGQMIKYWHLASTGLDPVRVYGDACSSYGGCELDSLCFRAWSPSKVDQVPTNFIQQERLYFERLADAAPV